MTTDITTDEELRVLLRIIYSAKCTEAPFKPAEELKRGDKVRITLEKFPKHLKTKKLNILNKIDINVLKTPENIWGFIVCFKKGGVCHR